MWATTGNATGSLAVLLALGILTAACELEVEEPPPAGLGSENEAAPALTEDPRDAFFRNLGERCGDHYPGRAVIAPEEDETFYPADLSMELVHCDRDEIRITFWVDGDDSRTWVLERSDEGLLFTHEEVGEDGELTERSGWGGWATENGTELFQHFPDHRWDPDDPDAVPEERRSHWRLRLDPTNGQFVYYLDRGLDPDYRLVFHMGQSRKVLEAFGDNEASN